MNCFYRIIANAPEGKFWSAAAAGWVEAFDVVDDRYGTTIVNTVQTLGELASVLREYGYPLGELAAPDDLVKEFEAAVTRRLDAFAREKQYDNMDKARLASLTADFRTDGDFANRLYDQVWTAAFALEDRIRAGALTVDGALAQLPETRWPPAHEA